MTSTRWWTSGPTTPSGRCAATSTARRLGPDRTGRYQATAAWGQVALGPDPVGFGGQWGYQGVGGAASLLGHRLYDASTGRFLTRDPIGYAGGVNLYGFAHNNPVTGRDPEGTDDSNPFSYFGNMFDHATLAGVAGALWNSIANNFNLRLAAHGLKEGALIAAQSPIGPTGEVGAVRIVGEAAEGAVVPSVMTSSTLAILRGDGPSFLKRELSMCLKMPIQARRSRLDKRPLANL